MIPELQNESLGAQPLRPSGLDVQPDRGDLEEGRMDSEPTVFVVDDDDNIRESLRFLIESVGLKAQTFSSAQSFLENYDPAEPGCVVLDVRMPGMSGLELQDELNAQGIEIPVIIVTAYGDIQMAVRAIKAGAIDFVEKPAGEQALLDQIQKAIAKDSEIRETRADQQVVTERFERLTPREREVMELVVDGLSSKEIAAQLGVSFKTVEAHRAKIMKKMEARSVPHLIRLSLSLRRT
jgi:RNA polymerase sigma factor (sigma-70 family)